MALDPRLAADTLSVAQLPLCSVRLMNDARYPWIILVPRVEDAVELLDLSDADQQRLYDEIRQCARVLQEHTSADKLNIAALGNVVRQLHVHVVARFHDDDAWPKPVWGVHPAVPYEDDAAATLIQALATRL
ncbi:MAG: HIT family protein [Gammaproteobacteria bacterium]